ncbi:Cytochrome c2 [Roseivivax jejudonensis]|uniref:Cytochrome c2 n=1 Tax=Roseivivax jejudonensis TaxID=1529041 RepID=A0A1X6YW87_9RHOB|nr:c-type cytochrome [Roseivivax jejudonensis]SLN32624.1 Cytochrome c2 [Roseivivax jejudonensis]
MSKSPLKIYAPTFGGIAVLLGGAYVFADQFVAETPAVGFGVSAAHAQSAAGASVDAADGAPSVPEPADMEKVADGSDAMEAADGASRHQAAAPSRDGGYGLGRAALEEEVAAWDIDIRPDGQGLPEGEGDVWTGEELYVAQCATCHGDFGEGAGRWPQLALGMGTLTSDDPVKTVGSYWPYLSTVWDYVHRAMPFGAAQTLSDDEVYAITAYILYLNELVEDDFVLSSSSFADVEMPNAGNFFMDDRPDTELTAFSGEVCMENCKEDVQITARARVLDVTPDAGGGEGTDPTQTPTMDEAMDGGGQEDASAPAAAAPETGVAETADAASEAPDAGATQTAAADPALVEAGAAVFRKCQACHQVGDGAANRVGPQLNGLIGRTVGGLDGYSYSGVFADAAAEGVVWTEAHLAEFLSDPRGTYQGTKMSFAGLRSADEIAAVTAYIEAEGTE